MADAKNAPVQSPKSDVKSPSVHPLFTQDGLKEAQATLSSQAKAQKVTYLVSLPVAFCSLTLTMEPGKESEESEKSRHRAMQVVPR